MTALRSVIVCSLIGVMAALPMTASPQLMVVPNPTAGQVLLVDSSGRVRSVIDGVGYATHVATDGISRSWVVDVGAGQIHLIDHSSGLLHSQGFSGFVIDLAMTADRGAVLVTRWGGATPGQLVRVSPTGSVLWQIPIDSAVTAVDVDALGNIYTVHGLGYNIGTLSVRDRTGVPVSERQTGRGPTSLATSRDGTIHVLCGGSDELWIHSSQSPPLIRPLPSGVAGMALDHHGLVALSRPGEEQLLICSLNGQYQHTHTLSGGPNGLGWCGDGRVMVACSTSGVISWVWPQSITGEFAVVAPGAICRGDLTGYQWAATAGSIHDSDLDGFPNSEEIDGGSHPFQSTSSPMSIRMDQGIPGHCQLSSFGTPGAIFILGLSHERTDRALGYLGLSVPPDVIALASLHTTVFQASPFGAFNAIGQAYAAIDSAALTSVAPVWASFLAFPEFPSLQGRTASPAIRLVGP